MNCKKIFLASIQWLFICILVGLLSGAASAFFLVSLEWVTQIREHNRWIIWLLPIGGLIIGLLYYHYGTSVVKGNNLILEEYNSPQKKIPLMMFPLVLICTLITHLFGGSAGREGTAVQMGASIADQFSKLFKLKNIDRKTILILGISAGFSSIFGTPLAGALFALELVYFSKINLKSVILSFVVGYIAYFTTEFLQIKHTHYTIPIIPEIDAIKIFWVIAMGSIFGLTAMLFSKTTHFWGNLFSKNISYPPLRPVIGGIILALIFQIIGTSKYNGLGIPIIIDSFTTPNVPYDFFLKILFTGFTLGSGFKGGEVTPLFFIGATLGSALSVIIPLPIGLLAGMGFVAVFSGATHTPIACTIMGVELFGIESGMFIGIACLSAYIFSGSVGIYHNQIIKGPKYRLYQKIFSR